MRRCGRDEVVKHVGRMFESAADKKNVVCKPEIGKIRVTVVLGKSDSVVVSFHLPVRGFIMYWKRAVGSPCLVLRLMWSCLPVVRGVLRASACSAPQRLLAQGPPNAAVLCRMPSCSQLLRPKVSGATRRLSVLAAGVCKMIRRGVGGRLVWVVVV